jgi:hypothetical protein
MGWRCGGGNGGWGWEKGIVVGEKELGGGEGDIKKGNNLMARI